MKIRDVINNIWDSKPDEILSKLIALKESEPESFNGIIHKLKDKKNRTPLLISASRGQIDVVNWLIKECHIDVQAVDMNGMNYLQHLSLSAINLAKKEEYEKLTQMLEHKGVNFSQRDAKGESVETVLKEMIYKASREGGIAKLQSLKLHQSKKLKQLLKREVQTHLLLEAAKKGDLDLIRWLIDEGNVDTYAKNHEQLDYVQCLNLAAIRCIQSRDYKKLKGILEWKEVALNTKNHKGETAESILFHLIRNEIKKNNLEELKKIRSFIPNLFDAIINQCNKNNFNLFLLAAKEGHAEIVAWLEKECDVNSSIKDMSGRGYLEYLNRAVFKFVKEPGNFGKIMPIMEYKGVALVSPDGEGQLLESILFDLIQRSVNQDNQPILKALADSKILNHFGYADVSALYESIQLGAAILADDLGKVRTLLNNSNLNRTLFKERLTPLELALTHNKIQIAENLIQMGARAEVSAHLSLGASAQECIAEVTRIDSRLTNLIQQLNKRLMQTETALQRVDQSELKQRQVKRIEFSLEILTFINRRNPSSVMEDRPYEKIDYLLLMNRVLTAIEQTDNIENLEKQLTIILGEREDAILNTSLDYCFARSLMANGICEFIAGKINPLAQYNQLLHNAGTKGRITDWYDAVGMDQIMPETSKLLRLPGNEVHLTEQIVELAINRMLNEECRLLEHVLIGTDYKFYTRPTPLKPEAISLLKQLSRSLKQLIEYIQKLDAHTRIIQQADVYEQFVILKNGLYEGDYRAHNDHLNAGVAAYIAIAAFADWWDKLKTVNILYWNRITRLSHMHDETVETMGQVINAILDRTDLNNNQRRDNAIYCVNVKANMISRMLRNPDISQELKEMKLGDINQLPNFKVMKKPELRTLQAKIFSELADEKIRPQNVVLENRDSFIDKRYWELNLFLQKNNIINRYSDFLPTKNRNLDIKKIIEYILSETDNDNLMELRKILNHKNFDHLRKVEQRELGIFKSAYFAVINGVRTPTNKQYALLEETLSAQLVKNATDKLEKHSEARAVVRKLYAENSFMSCNRKHQYPASSHEYAKLFDSYHGLGTMKKDLGRKIDTLRSSAQRIR